MENFIGINSYIQTGSPRPICIPPEGHSNSTFLRPFWTEGSSKFEEREKELKQLKVITESWKTRSKSGKIHRRKRKSNRLKDAWQRPVRHSNYVVRSENWTAKRVCLAPRDTRCAPASLVLVLTDISGWYEVNSISQGLCVCISSYRLCISYNAPSDFFLSDVRFYDFIGVECHIVDWSVDPVWSPSKIFILRNFVHVITTKDRISKYSGNGDPMSFRVDTVKWAQANFIKCAFQKPFKYVGYTCLNCRPFLYVDGTTLKERYFERVLSRMCRLSERKNKIIIQTVGSP